MGVVKRKRLIHLTARTLNIIFGALFVAFFVGEGIGSALGVSNDTGGVMEPIDWIGLVLGGVMIAGFIIAWWRPIIGGVMILAGIVLPVTLSVQRGGLVIPWVFYLVGIYGLVALTAALNIVDGVWRRGGFGGGHATAT